MAVHIRLARHGTKKAPFFRIVVTDHRNPRDGRHLENIGTFHPAAMHFDHRPGMTKAFDIGFGCRRYGKDRILAEIAKCDLVCANCHAVRTFERRHGA